MSDNDAELDPQVEPESYTSAPPETDHDQDILEAEGEDGGLVLARALVAPTHVSPRNFHDALLYARGQVDHPSQDWTGYCQAFVRSCWGIPPLFGSAWAQWLGADDADKHIGGDIDAAPLGSALIFKGSGQYGHIEFATYPFPTHTSGSFSNDLVTTGRINKVSRRAATDKWGQQYMGYLTAVNDYDLQLGTPKAPKPKQDKQYQAIAHAITRLERALETATKQKDAADIRVLNRQIRQLKHAYAVLRHS
ncbi:MAG: hypothetical protein HOV97_05110 [Nonomuraea sp.]|nr:hypothetical protein [Nonomuraea sp.]